MNFYKRFYDLLHEKSQERGWQSAFAHKAGISQDALSKIISKRTKSPGLEIVAAIVDALGAEAFLPQSLPQSPQNAYPADLSRTTNHAHSHAADAALHGTAHVFSHCPSHGPSHGPQNAQDLTHNTQHSSFPRIPVLSEEKTSPQGQLFSPCAQGSLPVLPSHYRQGMWAVRVTGDTMAPLICRGAYVGVIPVESLEDGGIYLVRKAPFGHMVKRVRMDEAGNIVLHAENEQCKPQAVPLEDYEDIIVGHVIWWCQLA